MSRLTTSFSPLVRSTSTEGSCGDNVMVSQTSPKSARSRADMRLVQWLAGRSEQMEGTAD
jgi:hypothetical protein